MPADILVAVEAGDPAPAARVRALDEDGVAVASGELKGRAKSF